MRSRTIKSQSKKLPLLRQLPLLASLGDAELGALAAETICRITPPGKEIFQEGNKLDEALFVASGMVALLKNLPDRSQIAVELALSGDPIGLVAALQDVPAPLSARALRESVIVAVPLGVFTELAGESPRLKDSMLELTASRFRGVQARLTAHLGRNADARVIAALRFLAERLNRNGGYPFELDIARRELALYAGLRTETVIRVTKQLESLGYLTFPHRKLIRVEKNIDIDQLTS